MGEILLRVNECGLKFLFWRYLKIKHPQMIFSKNYVFQVQITDQKKKHGRGEILLRVNKCRLTFLFWGYLQIKHP